MMSVIFRVFSLAGLFLLSNFAFAGNAKQFNPEKESLGKFKVALPSDSSQIQKANKDRLGRFAEPMLSQQFPWSAVGRIERDDGRFCTGTMVGSNLVLTSAECVISAEGEGSYEGAIRFYPNYKNGVHSLYSESYRVTFARVGYDPEKPRTDWAVLHLNSHLGLKTGWFGWRTLRDFLRYNYYVAEYSPDFRFGDTAGVFIGCAAMSDTRYTADMGCALGDDIEGAGAGGPVFAQFGDQIQLVGITTAAHYGMAVKSQNFDEVLRRSRNENDRREDIFTHVCNWRNEYQNIRGTVAYPEVDRRSWTSKGWFDLEPGECKEIELRAYFGGEMSIYAAIDAYYPNKLTTGQRASFCVSGEDDFVIEDAASMPCAEGQQRLNFSQRVDRIEPSVLSIFAF